MPNLINNTIAAQLSFAAYTPLSNYQSNTNVPTLPSGWTALTQFSGVDPTGTNQFITFTNGSQIVVAFKGSDNLSNFMSDVTNSGGSDWESIKQTFDPMLADLRQAYPSEQIFTDGHSEGGGMAQTAALENNLSGYGQNSLSVSQTAINSDMGGSPTNYFDTWKASGNSFNEVNVQGDIATLIYSKLGGQFYLDPSPTTLASPYAACEVNGAVAAVEAYPSENLRDLTACCV